MTIALKRAATFCVVKKGMYAQMRAKLMKKANKVREKSTLTEMKELLKDNHVS